jgi:hypothetical protein
MPTPQEIAALDQHMATLVDFVAPTIKRLYDALIHQGFTEQQAFEMSKTALSDLMNFRKT